MMGFSVIEYMHMMFRESPVEFIMNSVTRERIKVQSWLEKQLEFCKDDYYLNQLIKNQGWDRFKPESQDYLVVEILRWVINNIKYTSDKVQYNRVEYWANPRDTYFSREGDCEDGAVLLFILCRMCGVEPNRISIMVGDVKEGKHCWARYVPIRFPYIATYLDWCYNLEKRRIMEQHGRKYYDDHHSSHGFIYPRHSGYMQWDFIAHDRINYVPRENLK